MKLPHWGSFVLLAGCASLVLACKTDRDPDRTDTSAESSTGGTSTGTGETSTGTGTTGTGTTGTGSTDASSTDTDSTSTTGTSITTTDPSEGTGMSDCQFAAAENACEEPNCVPVTGRRFVEIDGKWCLEPTQYMACVECQQDDAITVMCKDDDIYEVDGVCQSELGVYAANGFVECDPPAQDVPACG